MLGTLPRLGLKDRIMLFVVGPPDWWRKVCRNQGDNKGLIVLPGAACTTSCQQILGNTEFCRRVLISSQNLINVRRWPSILRQYVFAHCLSMFLVHTILCVVSRGYDFISV